jgi:hypothetical protein
MMTSKAGLVTVRFTNDEKQHLQSVAALNGKSISEYIRCRLFALELTENGGSAEKIMDTLHQAEKDIKTLKHLLLFFAGKTLPAVELMKISHLQDIESVFDLLHSEIAQEIKNLLPDNEP